VGKSETLLADLVLDASGRSTRLPEWLQAIGYQAPAQTQVDSKLGYASCLYSRLSFEPDWKIIGINTKAPNQRRGGTISLQEGGKWIVSLLGYGRQHQAPTDPEAFLAFAKSLSRPDIYQALKGAEPISDISGFANITNTWNHYERLERFPAGLVVLGDAVCCFNPIYAQGMTTVALAAETLDQCLSQIPSIDALGMTFQKRMAKVIASPWLLATGTDFQFPETEGKRPGGMTGLAQGYLERLLGMIHHDTQVATAFVEVMNMLKPPTALFHPSLFVKVLSHSMSGKPEKAPALPVHG
jgi:hypothetical protein